ncbi:hypothetical protein JXA56_02110, partial [Candidatus Micrarchaeota archaeon]|nr:hypothetical protein [Candidatus Micrarchaeota archaeon]
MAQPAMKEKPKTQQQLGLEAAQHYADFIRTGKEESRQKFLDIYQANQNNDVFFNSFAERLKKNHAPLIQAYARNNEDADPLKVLDSIAAFHREFQKPEEERNMNIVRVTYGSDFVSEMEKAIQQPEQAVRPPETKPAEPEPAEARPAEPEPAEARPAEPEPVPKTRETQQPKKAEVQAGLAETAVDYLKHFITTGDAKSKAEFLRIWRENQKDDTFYAAVVELVRQNPQVFKKLIMSYYEHNDRVHPKMSEEDKLPTPEKLVAAVSEFYAELRKPTDKQNISKLSSKYGADFVKEMERIQQKHVVPVRVPSVDEISIDYLIHTFSVKLPPNASKQQKMEGLVKSIGTWFQISDRREANELTTTLLRAYSIMDKKERQSFSSWLIMMDPAQRKSLADQVRVKASARTLSVPYEFVKSEYLSWFENQKNKSEEISDIERNIRGFPSYVKEGTLEQFARQFEKDPSQYNFGLIGKRIEYLELKIQSAHLRGKSGEAETYEKEKKQLLSWFESIGIKAEDVTSAIIEMNAGLFTIQELYYSLDPESPGLMEYLAGIKPKPKLFMIYKKRLSEIDARSGKIFVGVQVKDPDYLTKIAERAGTRLTPARVQKGQGTWHEEYYKPNSPSQSDVDRNPAEAQMY